MGTELDYPQGMADYVTAQSCSGRAFSARRTAHWARWGAGLVLLAALGPGLARGADNGGLGPFSVRNMFPVALPYLNFVPEPVLPLPESTLDISYQYAVANTFINTQYSKTSSNPVIRQPQVDAGLNAANFPAQGYGAYIDLESAVHTLRFRYGFTPSVELGLDQSWVTFGRGSLDNNIGGVETAFNGVNQSRSHATTNQYHYFLAKDGKLLIASEKAFDFVPQDPVFSLKWNWGEGGKLLPAVSLKLAYKSPLDAAESQPRSLVSSGKGDFGYYLMFSKSVGFVVAHFQIGETLLSTPHQQFAGALDHKLFGLEFRGSNANSFLLELVTQSSIFRRPPADSIRDDFQISRPTDVVVMGWKHQRDGFKFDLGFVEDLNAQENETDIALFFSFGWKW